MRITALIFLWAISFCVNSQTVMNLDSVGAKTSTGNVYNRSLFGDSLSSSFCIVIRKEVKPHYHARHSEQVVVLDGTGLMTLGDKQFSVKKGDVVFIPMKTVHSVKVESTVPLKIVSIQSPRFDGSDRVMAEDKNATK
jgi:mannose-6-phosphate isomerase-like protein (cupin superfamily)